MRSGGSRTLRGRVEHLKRLGVPAMMRSGEVRAFAEAPVLYFR
jgi:hypothetical protein